jgi:hypothetical protein
LAYNNKTAISAMTIGILGFLMLFSQFGLLAANAQEDLLTEQQAIQTLNGPVFLDAYWVDRNSSTDATASARKEVGPGDGASTLAVILVNRGTSPITAVTGSLILPEGFSAYGSAGAEVNTVQASYNQMVEEGAAFTLYFDINVSDKATVGTYTTNLKVEFSRVREVGTLRDAELSVPFRLTGKVILDPVVVTRNLVPGVSNNVDIAVRNSGSAPATGTVVSITGININSGSTSSNGDASGLRPQITSFGTNTFAIGTVPPSSNTTFTTSLFPNIAAGGNTAGIQLQITYNDANGNSRTLTPTIGVIVLQNAPSIVGVRASSGVNETDNHIVAGKADNFVLEIANKGTTPITNAVVTIESTSTSLNILGDSKWAVDQIGPHSQANLETRVFAATSLIGNPATFDVTIDYLLDGSPKTEKYVLGTYIDGEIVLRVYDLTINYVGTTPTLVGNILNEGNAAALFTTIELVQPPEGSQFPARGDSTNGNQFGASSGNFTRQQSTPPSPQYLGDLTANSPLPFSMPFNIQRNGEQAAYPVTLKITYKDSLRNPHEFVASQNAVLAQQQPAATSQFRSQRQDASPMLLIVLIAAAIAGAVAAFFIIRKRRRANARKAQAPNNGGEKRENIEDILQNPAAEDAKKGQPT